MPDLNVTYPALALVADHFILAVRSQTVLCLDMHASKLEWLNLPKLSIKRENPSVIYMQRKAYVFGGKTGETQSGETHTNTIEKLDFDSSVGSPPVWQTI